jgi:hypothetical protein
VSLRWRWARSSGGAAGSTSFSTVFQASSWARTLFDVVRFALVGVATVSPISTRQRMASEPGHGRSRILLIWDAA